MTDRIGSITDLPLDILVLVFPYLDAKSFLSLCSTCKAFQQPSIRLDPAYWSFATRSAFRVPNQPVVQHDGVRWQKMYRRLLTQSHVFTWGSNTHSRLGHGYDQNPSMPRARRPGMLRYNNQTCSFPTEMEDTRDLGVIADMQCGGWSTTLLTSKGSLHTVGVLDGQRVLSGNERLRPLTFPAGYSSSSADAQYEEPTTAIRQFSAGRSHILALSDSGRIWSWYHVKRPALQVKFASLDLKELSLHTSPSQPSAYGQVKQVVAGWSRSSAFVQGIGIVVWDPVERDHGDDLTDTMLVLEHAEVPKTGYKHAQGKSESAEEKALAIEVGAVQSYIVLEHFVVFVTDIGRVYCGRFGDKNRVDNILELRQLRNENGTSLDVQGSFRRFAIFKNGEVITTNQDYLEACWSAQHTDPEQNNIQGLKNIPALQHNDVISVAFGDYHYLALHSNGKITSYGTEMHACGALGLGDETGSGGQARGILYDRFSHNGQLLPHAYIRGRQVWFDTRKKEWVDHVVHGKKDEEESAARRSLFDNDRNVQGEVSEWFEQEGRTWDQDGGEDGLGAYFALRVSAAGWHSGALVLVNEELASKEATYKWEDRNFPRLRLADGTEMPGEQEFDEWREPRPEWQLNADSLG
ncbi:RCC1/BLIP-II [Cucurbitaria berberidis CBS 394.84]|uniref:RCC1/BLIP-II n=1 Tax=Cucurbitaria berberidis CBS 394.84 TaxID=1168544 RepID=A0A9P4GK84_9PLEO|nr:RCC1/BLIP-II [Cucurbitaria berberidis CBS 394.84]KAF1847157.1 RCC1/BLIP-II [Cucurbitaria berberidis CBS 394.84]